MSLLYDPIHPPLLPAAPSRLLASRRRQKVLILSMDPTSSLWQGTYNGGCHLPANQQATGLAGPLRLVAHGPFLLRRKSVHERAAFHLGAPSLRRGLSWTTSRVSSTMVAQYAVPAVRPGPAASFVRTARRGKDASARSYHII
jgi:hypothetical protein